MTVYRDYTIRVTEAVQEDGTTTVFIGTATRKNGEYDTFSRYYDNAKVSNALVLFIHEIAVTGYQFEHVSESGAQ